MNVGLNTFCARGCRFISTIDSRSPALLKKNILLWHHNGYKVYSRFKTGSDLPLTKGRLKTLLQKKSSPKQVPKDRKEGINALFKPVPFSVPTEADGSGAEIAGKLDKAEVGLLLQKFGRKPEIRITASEHGLDGDLFQRVFYSFRSYCAKVDSLPVELYVRLKDITQDAGHPDDLFPYFMDHAKQIFPHLTCMDDLKKISDLTTPANWYPEARSIERKIIYHAGPTNSGKTFHALQRMFEAKSGIYCAPLKLLANEVFQKSNAAGTPCDLITGEEKRYIDEECPASHLACTIEMASVTETYEVAVIDEIQMIKDSQRGWAWTRALLGLNAEEVHVCGEDSAIDLVKSLMAETFDEVEVRRYKRLTELHWLKTPLGEVDNVRPGDCIVCFSKKDIFNYRQKLEKRGIKCAVVYGSLPPGAKLSEAARFNDPKDPCKVLIATDAIGMGLNLSIRRIIFHKLIKPTRGTNGELEMENISTSQVLQIGGRAGRFGMDFDAGEVTTVNSVDIKKMHRIIKKEVEPINQAGLHPTAEQIETFAYHLPGSTLSELISIFEGICQLDGEQFFMCIMDDFKVLADVIEHVPLSLRARYVFCCAPLNTKDPFLSSIFLKFARRVAHGENVTFTWLCKQIGWPFKPPENITQLEEMESVHDALDLYLWLSYRFTSVFPDVHQVRDIQTELDLMIQKGVKNMINLIQEKLETKTSDNFLTIVSALLSEDSEDKSQHTVDEDYNKLGDIDLSSDKASSSESEEYDDSDQNQKDVSGEDHCEVDSYKHEVSILDKEGSQYEEYDENDQNQKDVSGEDHCEVDINKDEVSISDKEGSQYEEYDNSDQNGKNVDGEDCLEVKNDNHDVSHNEIIGLVKNISVIDKGNTGVNIPSFSALLKSKQLDSYGNKFQNTSSNLLDSANSKQQIDSSSELDIKGNEELKEMISSLLDSGKISRKTLKLLVDEWNSQKAEDKTESSERNNENNSAKTFGEQYHAINAEVSSDEDLVKKLQLKRQLRIKRKKGRIVTLGC